VVVPTVIALALAVLLTLAGRAAEAVGRALGGSPRRSEPTGPPLPELVVAWPSRLLAGGRPAESCNSALHKEQS
jgi:hypothetical protein